MPEPGTKPFASMPSSKVDSMSDKILDQTPSPAKRPTPLSPHERKARTDFQKKILPESAAPVKKPKKPSKELQERFTVYLQQELADKLEDVASRVLAECLLEKKPRKTRNDLVLEGIELIIKKYEGKK